MLRHNRHGQMVDSGGIASGDDGKSRISPLRVMMLLGKKTMLLFLLASCGISMILRSSVQQRHEQQSLPRAIGEEPSGEAEGGRSCVRSLLANDRAILANSSLAEPSVSFRILLHPPTVDRYITPQIMRKGTYELAMERFIAWALPRNETDFGNVWAVDIGANVGFHSMHMASRGANTISFEPAPDTAELLKCSAAELLDSTTSTGGSIEVVEAGASDVETEGRMSRHPASPGMTTFIGSNDTSFPLVELENPNNDTSTTSTAGTIRLVRAEYVLAKLGVPEGRSPLLRLLKVDVEGLELRAFRGLNLTRFPFRYLTFEFFPDMIRSSGDDPADVLLLVREAGYDCDYEHGVPMNRRYNSRATRYELNRWIGGIKRHVNIFCELKD